ncbi:TIGR00341 family protein [Psychrobacter sp. I-STPA10]|uniref:TIGR00341 family protein n=1 Tax=Psychrobacter sp. I-STPA10 TaxID=2585769 RepID=UPI001E5BAD72|nr:TIGR00341 family protein [Psychrobacter sp. I-STPA10]
MSHSNKSQQSTHASNITTNDTDIAKAAEANTTEDKDIAIVTVDDEGRVEQLNENDTVAPQTIQNTDNTELTTESNVNNTNNPSNHDAIKHNLIEENHNTESFKADTDITSTHSSASNSIKTTPSKKEAHKLPQEPQDSTEPKDDETLKEEKEAKLESYKQFVAEQASNTKIDYQKIRINIEANALPSRMYFIMNALSAVIASYGLVVNSAAVVIGAMLVAMMLGPISGVALAIIDYRMPFLKKSLLTVLAGGIMVVFIGFIIGLLHQGQPLTNEILSRTQPTSMDLMIALAGGTAGAYAIISPHLSVAVVGVAVATALVPPLAASGILFANGEMSLAFGALLLAFTNIIAIQFTNAMVLWFTGFRRLVKDDYKKSTSMAFLRRNAVPLLLLFGLGIYLSVNLNTIARTQRFENDVNTILTNYFIDKGDVLAATQFVNRDNHQVIRAVIRGVTRPTPADVKKLEQQITDKINNNYSNFLPVHLQLRYLPVVVIEADPTSIEQIDQTDAAILSNEN